MKKYELTNETKNVGAIILHRIKALKDFADVKANDLGGWVENENNLSHDGDAWVYENAEVYGNAEVRGNAKVYGNAEVYGDAEVRGNAKVYGNAEVYGDAEVCGNAEVRGNAKVYGNAWVYGDAEVCGNAEVRGNACYIVFKNWWSSGRFFTWTKSNNMWRVGCFYGTGQELIEKAYKDSEKSGREYERIVKYVEQIIKQEQ